MKTIILKNGPDRLVIDDELPIVNDNVRDAEGFDADDLGRVKFVLKRYSKSLI